MGIPRRETAVAFLILVVLSCLIGLTVGALVNEARTGAPGVERSSW